jgi:hypothetical protein
MLPGGPCARLPRQGDPRAGPPGDAAWDQARPAGRPGSDEPDEADEPDEPDEADEPDEPDEAGGHLTARARPLRAACAEVAGACRTISGFPGKRFGGRVDPRHPRSTYG